MYSEGQPPEMEQMPTESHGVEAMEQEEEEFSQTQHFTASSQQSSQQPPAGVVARLTPLHEPGPAESFSVQAEMLRIEIGRHPSCHIKVKDKHVSGTHLVVYRDEAFKFYVQSLSPSGAWHGELFMNKGDVRALSHGDIICIGRFSFKMGCPPDQKPFAAWTFVEISSERTFEVANKTSIQCSNRTEKKVEVDASGSNIVTDAYIRAHWDFRKVLGSGSFSEVRLGLQVQGGGQMRAVKVIDKKRFVTFQSKRESKLNLESEAKMVTGLDHPGIVKCYSHFETEANLFLVMEFIEGGDLLQNIMEHGFFAEPQGRRIFTRVCNAVAYIHERNIVHRDLKPENILITSSDRARLEPKLADFGLARMNMATRDCKTFCGTPHYFAPEVITTFRDREAGQVVGYGKPADMWSLGVILYILLSGSPPFEDEGLYQQICDGKYEFDVPEWTAVTPEAIELVRKLMTVDDKIRATIQQALDQKWLRIFGPDTDDFGPATSDRKIVLASQENKAPEPATKRRRTDDMTDSPGEHDMTAKPTMNYAQKENFPSNSLFGRNDNF